jgi:hypothetical protein
MPYRSAAQRRKFHAMLARGEISPAVVREYDRASKGKKLPERVKGKKIMAVRRKKATSHRRKAAHHRRRRDPAAAAAPLATATSRHRRKRTVKRKPARRRAKVFSLRDFLGISSDPGRRRRKAPKRAAKRKSPKRAAAARKGWRTGHVKAKRRAHTQGRRKKISAHKKRRVTHRRGR